MPPNNSSTASRHISFSDITQEQTNIIKGLAITLIVFHNIIHHTNTIGENQFDDEFSPDRIMALWAAIKQAPDFIINGILTYFGHFGVQAFIFVSGYGLAKKYMNYTALPYKTYYRQRLTKIYVLLFFGIVVNIIAFSLIIKYWPLDYFYLKKTVLCLTTIGNFFGLMPIWGPWWFFGLIIQLYLLFPLLFTVLKRYSEKGFFGLGIISYLLIYAASGIILLLTNLPPPLFTFVNKHTPAVFSIFIGHTPEFLLGMALAMFPSLKITKPVLLVSLAVFILANVCASVFPLGFLSATILLLTLFRLIYIRFPQWFLSGFSFLGKISMCIFLFNAPVRNIVRRRIGLTIDSDSPPLLLTLKTVFLFAVIVVFSYLMWLLYDKLMQFLKRKGIV
ncbi:MAG: acyltransferase family protein [Prevotella sp.]|jgi:peptidoglycan/LPS O-acetylase OafA/YrhL|nr:acyltransferase family protein [Prevotella sp.]